MQILRQTSAKQCNKLALVAGVGKKQLLTTAASALSHQPAQMEHTLYTVSDAHDP